MSITRRTNFGFECGIGLDNVKFYLGAGKTDDAYMYFDGSDLIFYDVTLGSEKTLSELAAAGSSTLDAAFDGGNAIDNAQPDADAGVQIGDGTNYLSIYEGGDTHCYLESSVGDIKFISAGGDVDFDDDNITTTGIVTADGGMAIGADDAKLTLGDDDDTDAYLLFDGSFRSLMVPSSHAP